MCSAVTVSVVCLPQEYCVHIYTHADTRPLVWCCSCRDWSHITWLCCCWHSEPRRTQQSSVWCWCWAGSHCCSLGATEALYFSYWQAKDCHHWGLSFCFVLLTGFILAYSGNGYCFPHALQIKGNTTSHDNKKWVAPSGTQTCLFKHISTHSVIFLTLNTCTPVKRQYSVSVTHSHYTSAYINSRRSFDCIHFTYALQ